MRALGVSTFEPGDSLIKCKIIVLSLGKLEESESNVPTLVNFMKIYESRKVWYAPVVPHS